MSGTITIQTRSDESITAELAPPWYLASIGLSPQTGDFVEVIGTPPDGPKNTIIADEVMCQGNLYRLRTDNGDPPGPGASLSGTSTGACGTPLTCRTSSARSRASSRSPRAV
jgi:hypothetical protein